MVQIPQHPAFTRDLPSEFHCFLLFESDLDVCVVGGDRSVQIEAWCRPEASQRHAFAQKNEKIENKKTDAKACAVTPMGDAMLHSGLTCLLYYLGGHYSLTWPYNNNLMWILMLYISIFCEIWRFTHQNSFTIHSDMVRFHPIAHDSERLLTMQIAKSREQISSLRAP